MNITKEIMKNLNKMGYTEYISPVVEYYLQYNINNMIGTDYVASENVFFRAEKPNKMVIKIVCNENTYEISGLYIDNDFHLCCEKLSTNDDKSVSKEMVFDITFMNDKVRNRYFENNNTLNHTVDIFEYNLVDPSFSLYKGSFLDGDFEYDYAASMAPFSITTSSCVWFEYKRSIPPFKEEKSFLKKIVESLSGSGNLKKIHVNKGCESVESLCEEVFEFLLMDEKKVLANQKSESSKNILEKDYQASNLKSQPKGEIKAYYLDGEFERKSDEVLARELPKEEAVKERKLTTK